jgi:hypothetical protein
MVRWRFKTEAKIMKQDSSLRKRVYPNKVHEMNSQEKISRRKVILDLWNPQTPFEPMNFPFLL